MASAVLGKNGKVRDMKAQGIVTVGDVRDAKMANEAREDYLNTKAINEANTEQARIEAILRANPKIGVLGHGKNRRYYTGAGENQTHRIEDLI